jgi:hypothetical protein
MGPFSSSPAAGGIPPQFDLAASRKAAREHNHLLFRALDFSASAVCPAYPFNRTARQGSAMQTMPLSTSTIPICTSLRPAWRVFFMFLSSQISIAG